MAAWGLTSVGALPMNPVCVGGPWASVNATDHMCRPQTLLPYRWWGGPQAPGSSPRRTCAHTHASTHTITHIHTHAEPQPQKALLLSALFS